LAVVVQMIACSLELSTKGIVIFFLHQQQQPAWTNPIADNNVNIVGRNTKFSTAGTVESVVAAVPINKSSGTCRTEIKYR
jgi:hypothetical protein